MDLPAGVISISTPGRVRSPAADVVVRLLRVLLRGLLAGLLRGRLLAAEHPPRRLLLLDQAQATGPAGEDLPDQLGEVGGGGGEGLLEGLLDLPVGLADQGPQLPHRGLEVLALALELFHVGERLGVLELGQRVDGPELLTAALEPLHPRAQLRDGLLVQRLGGTPCGGAVLDPEALEHPGELELGLAGVVAGPLGVHLRVGDHLSGPFELGLDPRLAGGKGGQLAGAALALPAVFAELLLERAEQGARTVGCGLEGRQQALGARAATPRRAGRRPAAAAAAPRRSASSCSAAASCAALAGELSFELCFADRKRPVGGGLSALVDQPRAAAHRLLRLGLAALVLAQLLQRAGGTRFGARQLRQRRGAALLGLLQGPAGARSSRSRRSRSLRLASTRSLPPALS